MRRMLLAGFGLGMALPAAAQDVTVQIDPAAAQAAGVDADEVEAQVAAGLGASDSLQGFVDQMAAANALAGRGLGVDYASNPKTFFVGYALSVGSGAPGLPAVPVDGSLPSSGFGFQASGSAGLNLGVFAPKNTFLRRVVVSGNGGWAHTSPGVLDTELYNVGGHVQIKAIGPFENTAFSWGGIDVTSGYEISAYRVSLTESQPVQAGDLTWDATGSLEATAVDRTIPLEISTNARIAVISVYGGAALDLHTQNSARVSGDVSGPLAIWAHGDQVDVGSVAVHTDLTSGEAAHVVPRVFAGVELQASWFKLYGQFNTTLDDAWSGNMGVRLAR